MDSEYTKRMKRFNDARFGMFIHWGAYAVAARGEWVKSIEKLTDGQYRKYTDALPQKKTSCIITCTKA